MRILARETKIDFIGKRKFAVVLSAMLILASIGSLIMHGGPNYGIDFEGGTLIQLKFKKAEPAVEIRKAIGAIGLGDFDLQEFGSPKEMLIRVGQVDEMQGDDSQAQKVEQALREKYGDNFTVERVEMVGPKVGGDLRYKAMMALIYSLAGILIYITFRFEFKFGVAAIIALIHDTMITVGAFSVFDKEFTLTVIAALLTVIGYSLNDTIVVFDRIRENMRLKRGMPMQDLMNISINQTLSRTLLTSGTTLFVVLSIFFLGGEVIHDFAFALLIGVIIGTYSSIFVASPALLLWKSFSGGPSGHAAGRKRKEKKRAKT